RAESPIDTSSKDIRKVPCVQISRLPLSTPHDEIMKFFKTFKPLRAESDNSNWYIEFETMKQAENAVRVLNNEIFLGRRLHLETTYLEKYEKKKSKKPRTITSVAEKIKQSLLKLAIGDAFKKLFDPTIHEYLEQLNNNQNFEKTNIVQKITELEKNVDVRSLPS